MDQKLTLQPLYGGFHISVLVNGTRMTRIRQIIADKS